MGDERLTREQERAMLELLEQAALHDYPNPDRIGCPGAEFLKRLASNRRSIALSDARLDHVTRCSPCFREFVEFRDGHKRSVFTRRAVLATGGGALAAGLATVLARRPKSPSNPSIDYQQIRINLFDYAANRGVDSQPRTTAAQPDLPRKHLELRITLPFTSPEGKYEVQILEASGKPTGLISSGMAQIENGKTMLSVKMDLTSLSPNRYQVGIRRVPFDWMPVPVQVR
jgi:hypothetical protein